MPWVIQNGDATYADEFGGRVPTPRQARRYKDKPSAEALLPGQEAVTDTVRAGVDYPCALHKGPKGDCQQWNCRCY